MIFILFGIVVMIAAAILVVVSLFADSSCKQHRCRRCWYHIVSSSYPLKCPECGRILESSADTTRTRRHWKAAIGGIVLSLLGYALWSVPRIQSEGIWGLVPTTGLVIAAPWLSGRTATNDPRSIDRQLYIKTRWLNCGQTLRKIYCRYWTELDLVDLSEKSVARDLLLQSIVNNELSNNMFIYWTQKVLMSQSAVAYLRRNNFGEHSAEMRRMPFESHYQSSSVSMAAYVEKTFTADDVAATSDFSSSVELQDGTEYVLVRVHYNSADCGSSVVFKVLYIVGEPDPRMKGIGINGIHEMIPISIIHYKNNH